ncbi:hypothetical protein LTS10_013321 [Elasticomyces elasticus]|nr:hypothetical protein LTS10_013321 [Elasticomyces elasticus]
MDSRHVVGADDARTGKVASGEGKGGDGMLVVVYDVLYGSLYADGGRGRDARISASYAGAPTTDRETAKRRRPVSMWTRVGRIWEEEGHWEKSEKLFFAARTWCREKLGEEHVDTLRAMANLASTYRNQGRWKEAEELEVKVVDARSRVLGEEHHTLSAITNLASTYRIQGWWKEAEEHPNSAERNHEDTRLLRSHRNHRSHGPLGLILLEPEEIHLRWISLSLWMSYWGIYMARECQILKHGTLFL